MHIYPGLDRNLEGLVHAGNKMMHAVQALDIHPVTHDETVETEFVAEYIINQPRVRVARYSVEFVVRGHHRGDSRLSHRHLERGQVYLAHLTLAHIHGSSVESAGRFAATDKVLCAGQHLAFGEIASATLQAPDHVFSHLRNQPGVFAEGLPHPAPAGIAGHVEVRGEGPGHAGGAHLGGRLRTYLFQHLGIEGRCKGDAAGIYGAAGPEAVAVDGIDAEEQGDAQAGLAGEHLELMGFFAGEHVQEGSYLTIAYARGKFGVPQALVGSVDVLVGRALVRRNIAGAYVLAHLPYLLFQGHLPQEKLRALLRREGRILPVGFAATGCEQHGRENQILFHRTCIFMLVFSSMLHFPADTRRALPSQVQSLTLLPFTSTLTGLAVQRTSKL